MRKSGIFFIVCGAVLILSALLLLLHNQNEDAKAGEAASEALPEIKKYIAEYIESVNAASAAPILPDQTAAPIAPGASDQPDASEAPGFSAAPDSSIAPALSGAPAGTQKPEEFSAAPDKTAAPASTPIPAPTDGHVNPYDEEAVIRSYEMPVVIIGGYGYIGYISLPSLGLELPVMADWDYQRLKLAPCRYSGTTGGGDLVIAAHNYARHFGRLSSLDYGDVILFTGMTGERHAYIVTELLTLDPTAIADMTAGEWELTLFTCTYGGKSRVTVRASEVPLNSEYVTSHK